MGNTKMIEIFNEAKGIMESFKSYDDLLNHIKAIERQKLIEGDQEGWIFTIYSNETLGRLYDNFVKVTEILLTEKEQEAYEGGFEILETSKGDQGNITQVILLPDMDVNKIKKDWCKDYCLKHGYIFLSAGH
jgi:hypothetical protein